MTPDPVLKLAAESFWPPGWCHISPGEENNSSSFDISFCIAIAQHLCNDMPKKGNYLIIKEDTQYCCHHADNVGGADGVPEHQQGYTNDHDPLCCVGYGVTEWADQVQNAESDHVLRKVADTTDEEQHNCSCPVGNLRLQKRTEKKNERGRELRESQCFTCTPAGPDGSRFDGLQKNKTICGTVM